jgi:hypothetical protein
MLGQTEEEEEELKFVASGDKVPENTNPPFPKLPDITAIPDP